MNVETNTMTSNEQNESTEQLDVSYSTPKSWGAELGFGGMEKLFRIPTARMSEVEDNVAKLNKRALKLGFAPISFKVLGNVLRDTRKIDMMRRSIMESLTIVELVGGDEALYINGWSLVGSVEHTEFGNLLRSRSGFELHLEYRITKATRCDHCNVQRDRISTVVIVKDGQYMQVGRNCLHNFFAVDPMKAISWLECVLSCETSFHDLEDGEGGMFGGYVKGGSLDNILAHTLRVIQAYGWLSRSKAAEFGKGMPTADIVHRWMTETSKTIDTFYKLFPELKVELTPEQVATNNELIQAAIDYTKGFEQLPSMNDYQHNLLVIAKRGYADWKALGLAASMMSSYMRHMEMQLYKERVGSLTKDSVYVGEVGERLTMDVEIISVVESSNDFGINYRTKMVTTDGNLLTGFLSNNIGAAGDKCRISFGVKKHNEYQGRKETIVSRVTRWTEEGVKEADEKAAKKAEKAAAKAQKEQEKAAKALAKAEKAAAKLAK